MSHEPALGYNGDCRTCRGWGGWNAVTLVGYEGDTESEWVPCNACAGTGDEQIPSTKEQNRE